MISAAKRSGDNNVYFDLFNSWPLKP